MSFRLTVLNVTAVVAIGTLCAPGVPASFGQPSQRSSASTWVSIGAVPHAATVTTPALTSITPPGHEQDPLLFWTGPRVSNVYQISYARATSIHLDRWSRPAKVHGGTATTDSSPSAAPFGTTLAQVIVVWKVSGQQAQILYSIGTASKNGTLSWGPTFSIPGADTSEAPAVYTPLHSQDVFVAWKAAGNNNIDYAIGSPATGSNPLQWGAVGVLPGSDTAGTPAVAEANTGPGTGSLYVFWESPGTGRIERAATSDPLSSKLTWTQPVALPPAITTGAAPSVQAIGPTDGYPLLIIYRALHSTLLQEVALAQNGTVRGEPNLPSGSNDGPTQAVAENLIHPPQTLDVAAERAIAPTGTTLAAVIAEIRHCPGCGGR